MPRKLADCPHCKGKRNCTRSGGRSCKDCLRAAGRSVHQWGVVRCSYCGGLGRIWVEAEEEEPKQKEPAAGQKPAEAPAADSAGPADNQDE
jgi:hypothetical protein